eukprot:NODE_314_length_9990_cov_0.963401.p2 type:complete len:663 gc:universal NODE_314_length_9990_cov_0.963401:4187-6175(+)
MLVNFIKIFTGIQFGASLLTIVCLYSVSDQQPLINNARLIPNLRYLAFAMILMSSVELLLTQELISYIFVFNCFSWLISSSIITQHRRQKVFNWLNIVAELLFTASLACELKIENYFDIIILITVCIRALCLLIFVLVSARTKNKYFSHLKKLLPFLIPKSELKIQMYIFLSLMCLVGARVVNVLLPLQYKHVIDSLQNKDRFPVDIILLYAFINLLQGGSGYLASLQSFCFIPVRQFITRSIGVATFQHLHHLSMEFHINRKTGEVLRVMDRGTNSLSSIMQSALFNVLPIIIDISVAIGYFIIVFDAYFGLILFCAMFFYIFFTILITEWRSSLRRKMIDSDNLMSQIAVDSLLNFETVKLYNAEEYETKRYADSVDSYNKSDWRSSASLNLLNASQNTVICLCTLFGALYAGLLVHHGKITIGDFVMFITYLNQLYTPLNFFGTFYRIVAQNMVDLEKLIDLMEIEADIKDDENAEILKIRGGHLEIENLSFSYDGRGDALKEINIAVPPGKSGALVGSSGSGKSTIMKLLFRFYECTRGVIKIDGQDIRKVSQKSLRSRIGIVPQDCVLFNDSILYNVRYSRPTATDDEVFEACKQAQIHDKILTFPDGYQTKVGERGLRLSGGEKQRIAIARTFLKNPPIIFFDEVFGINLGNICSG